MSTADIQQKEKTAQLIWTGLIVMFFVIQAIIWTVAISITLRDTSHAVVSGYDEQALNWDEVKRQRSASEALGWKAEISVDPASDIRGNRSVTLYLKDHNDVPIKNAVVMLDAFHRGRAAEVQQLTMKSIGPGIFSGSVQVRNSGQWRFRGMAIDGENQFLLEQQLDIDSNRNL